MYPHPIRLRGPWQAEPLARSVVLPDGAIGESTSNLPRSGEIEVPGDWGDLLGAGFRGRVACRRRFGRPSGIEPHDRVWLVVEGVDARGEVSLNGKRLGAVLGYALPAEFDVTDLLDSRNELRMEVDLPAAGARQPGPLRPGRESRPGGPIRPVRLEVRSTHFPTGLGLRLAEDESGVTLHLAGRIAGAATTEPLAVVATAAGRELLYAEVSANEPFTLHSPIEPIAPWRPAEAVPPTPRSAVLPRPSLVDVELKLLRGTTRVWEALVRTGHRKPSSVEDAAITIGDSVLPWDSPLVVVQHEILTDADYTRCDQEGRVAIQYVPSKWSRIVETMLGHHPSIVAWRQTLGEG